MSRSKKDILDTEAMLVRLTALLGQHCLDTILETGQMRADAETLRRISITLRFWFEQECNGDIERTDDTVKTLPNGVTVTTPGKPYYVWHGGRSEPRRSTNPIPDRETGARKRLAQILKRYPSLIAYVQTDPRGCALYILKPGDVPEGSTVGSCYSRGLAVYR